MRVDEKLKIIYETIVPTITRTETAWKSYLKFASQIYKYHFDNAMLLYAQNPKVTMLATTPIWNKVGRYINKGEKGIAVCDYNNAKLTTKYLFDITQTNGKEIADIWLLTDETRQDLSYKLSKSNNIKSNNLHDSIKQIVKYKISESLNQYIQDFERDIKDHFISTLPRAGLISEYTEIIENSCTHFISCRCGITDIDLYVPTISHFDTIALITRLGDTITKISKEILLEISRNIKIIENERTEKYEQRNHEQPRIEESTEPITTGEHDRNRESTTRQIRTNGNELPARESSTKIYDIKDARRTNQDNGKSGQRSEGENRRNNTNLAQEEPINENRGHFRKDTPFQQLSANSRRNSNQGESANTEIKNNQTSIKEQSQESRNSGSFLTLEDNETKVINNQMSLFDLSVKETETDILINKFSVNLINHVIADENYINTCKNSSHKSIAKMECTIFINNYIQTLNKENHLEFTNTCENNPKFLKQLINHIFLKTYNNMIKSEENKEDQEDKPSKNHNDIPHKNYQIFNKLFPEISNNICKYMKFESKGFEPLIIERLENNRISIAHTFTQNDVLMYDPKMIIEFDNSEQTLQAITYDLSSMMFHQDVYEGTVLDKRLQKELNDYLLEWLTNTESKKYVPVNVSIIRNNNEYSVNLIKKNESSKEQKIIINDDITKEHNAIINNEVTKEKNNTTTATIVNNKDISNYTEPYVIIEWSESSAFSENERLSFTEADLKFKEVEKREREERLIENGTYGGYNKTNGFIYYKANEEDTDLSTHEFRYDIGDCDEDASGLYNHILSFWTYEEKRIKSQSHTVYKKENIDAFKRLLEILQTYQDTTFIPFANNDINSIPIDDIQPLQNKPIISKTNYHYSHSDNLYTGGAKTKFKANIEAIRLLKRLEADKRLATPDEQKILANYVGWGGLSNAFSVSASGWENEYKELKILLSEDEYKSAMNSTITAYYTDPKLITYMYKALENFGLTNGNNRKILDPAMGTGNFFSTIPQNLQNAKLHGIELDSISGRISKQLYQKANIDIQGFETTQIEDNTYDLAIGNIPFNNIKLYDKRYEDYNFLIHDYFIAKSIDLIKSGGIVAYITSKGTMDKQDTTLRKYIAERANLIGAVRLPNTSFKAIAGTEVTADILFFKKLEQTRNLTNAQLPDWVYTERRKVDYMMMNSYFIQNPHMILGEMKFNKERYGKESETACYPIENQDLYIELEKAINSFTANFSALSDEKININELTEETEEDIKQIKAEEGTKNCIYIIKDNKIYYSEKGYLTEQNITGKKAERIKGLCEIKIALQEVISVQTREYEYSELETAQKKLNETYDNFVNKYGYINNQANISAFYDDNQLPLLRSIEDLNDNKKTYTKAPIFTKATIKSYKQPTHAKSAKEALEISLNMKLKVDLQYMSSLYKKTEEEIIEELEERIYLNPEKYYGNPYEGWETAEEYLSGDVKIKLDYAKLKSEENEIFNRNVKALQEVQPPLLMPSDINFRIGSPWIPIEYFSQFMHETFETPTYLQTTDYGRNIGKIELEYFEYTGTWNISNKNSNNSIKANQTYGTKRMSAYEIYENCLNLQSATVRDRIDYKDELGKDKVKYAINITETMIARAKQQQINEAFSSWLFKDNDRAEILLKIYNETFNTIRPREYDGSHLIFNNMNEEYYLRQHQKNVVARIIYNGTCLMAHEVGAGKTLAMIAAGMYMKNIGAIKKPIYIVPNSITEQWAVEFLRFYPSANILVATKKDFEKNNRKKFISKIAMGDYDGIIIGQSQFEKIPISKERQEKSLNKEIAELTYIIDQMKKEKGETWAIKQIVIFQHNLKKRLEKLIKEERKDDLLTFEELGIDYMFVDEAHNYKNCFTYTKMRNIAGIGQSSSQRASDMLMKCRYIQEQNNGKGVTFATGTPISNSMSELFVMQRFLQPNILKKMKLSLFDSWAATFGEVVTSLEITPEGSGYRMKNRFAKFHNLPELMKTFKLVADIITSDMLTDLAIPEIVGGKANVVISECSDFQKQIMLNFAERAEAIRKKEVEPEIDNMLKLTNEAKLMAIDPRLIYPNAPSDPNSKLNMCIRDIFATFEETKDKKLTQVVFSDSGTPKVGTFNVYNEIKEQLIKMGVPEQEITFVHDAKTETQREDMYEKVRKGEIRIIIGSTSKLGTGVNIQDLLIKEHDLDVPWRPSDIIQRSGRILRQGNKNPKVYINRYVTKGTFDSYLWQIQEQKLRYITQIMTNKHIARSYEDIDETVLNAAEVKAIATSNPLLAEKMEVDNEVSRLKILKGNWNNEKLTLERCINKYYPETAKVCENRIKAINNDMTTLEQFKGKDFIMTIEGKNYTDKEKAGESLITTIKAKCKGENESVEIGEYHGLKILAKKEPLNPPEIYLIGEEKYSTTIGESAIGNITRIDNLLDKLPTMLNKAEQKLNETKAQLKEAQELVLLPFEHEEKLNNYIGKQSDINTKLEFKELSEQENVILNENKENDVTENNNEYEEGNSNDEYDMEM